MSLLWLLFASLTVFGSLSYNVGMKIGSANANGFMFVLPLTATILVIQISCFLAAKYLFGMDVQQGANWGNLKFAVLAGCGAATIDLAYFFAVKYGSLVSSQIFWTVGGTIALAVFAALFFHEPITARKALGIALGIASVVLICKG